MELRHLLLQIFVFYYWLRLGLGHEEGAALGERLLHVLLRMEESLFLGFLSDVFQLDLLLIVAI